LLGIDHSKVDINVVFAEINNQDALDRIEFEQAKQEALDRAITSLNNLGISFEDGRYTEVRNLLITRYLDTEILDAITESENGDVQNLIPQEDEGSEGNEHEPLPSGSSMSNPMDVNINTQGEEDFGEETTTGEEGNDEGLLPLPEEPPANNGSPEDTTLGEA
jgi:hypothetical protein